jgi:N,N'-diacetylchitobiose phosphorylase
MKYGYFDNDAMEYVITRPDTPASWINYLGTADYASLVSNNASGYAFHKSPRSGRLLRFRFNSVPTDRPGRYIYIRDEEGDDYWSATWQPVGKPLDTFKTECRHGLGYTRFITEYQGIRSHYRIFVPVDKPIEFWDLEIQNISDRPRALSVFPYAEWCFWMMEQDLMNFQYILYTCRMGYADDIIDYSIVLWSPYEPKGFMASTYPVTSFDTDREAFIGLYRDEGCPIALDRGTCANSIAIGGNACAAMQNRIHLPPGASQRLCYIVGVGDAKTFGAACKAEYSDYANVEAEFAKVQDYWAKRLAHYTCETPSDEVNTATNIWNQYQCHTTLHWSRSASFNEAGGRDGLGFRDSNQDVLGVVHAVPEEVKTKLMDLLKAQLSEGYAMHSVQPLTWEQGPHNIPAPERIYSDDHLWLLLSVPAYLKETGDMAFLDEVVPFADTGEATVYEHLKRALAFSWQQRGPHNLLLGLAADWNDCINLKGGGESTWSTFLYYRALIEFIELAKRTGMDADVAQHTAYAGTIHEALETWAWDGQWFLRGYLASGEKLGAQSRGGPSGEGPSGEGAEIFLNAQSWAVVSSAFTDQRAHTAMDQVKAKLATEHGLLLNYPAFRKVNEAIGAITSFPPGLKENGSIFCHANTWGVIAEALLGHGDQAFQYYLAYLPATKNDRAEVYTMEPYVYAQFITGKEHPYHFGRARNSWLTGTATWSFVAISQYILGVHPHYDGLRIDPAIPHQWDSYRVTRTFRGRRFHIQVHNPQHISHGVKSLIVNDEAVTGNLIPLDKMLGENHVEVVLG